MTPPTTLQLLTHLTGQAGRRLRTDLVERPLRRLRAGEILVEMMGVAIHGSFWLASHPDMRHPRAESFLRDGQFVFGNGGVGRVIAAEHAAGAGPGDVVAIYGHAPCAHDDCRACHVDERYTECEYGENTIIGHGRGAPDGTYAGHVILPPATYEVCRSAVDATRAEELLPFMYAFLVADVRNALTRSPDTLGRDRVLLFGAGQSGRIAAYLLLQANPATRFVVVDAAADRAAQLKSLKPDAIDVCVPPPDVVARLNETRGGQAASDALNQTIGGIVESMRRHFDTRTCNLLVDASSGNTTPLWGNARVLSPACQCIVFGFGSEEIRLDRNVIQLSGLALRMSRGVGQVANRREVVRLMDAVGASFVQQHLMAGAQRLPGLHALAAFVTTQHDPPRMLHEIPQAYCVIAPAATS